MKKFIFIMSWLFITSSLFSQQEFCPGNFFDNGDLEIGTPTGSDQDIDLAQGFSAIWGSGSIADYYAFNAGPFAPKPSPPTGNYAGFWVSNHAFTGTTWREGLYNTFLTPILANTGNYTFTFDIACLFKDAGINADVELGVYGIYNPTATLGVTPTDQFTPDNLNLFPGQTVLLGTIPLNGDCSNIKQNVSVNIATAGMPITSITHIMITHSDTVINYGADGGGKRYIGLDNFCLTIDDQEPQGETDYCCDSNVNEIRNGNFENGNTDFTSAYSLGSNSLYGTVPGQYFVGTNTDGLSISPLWDVNDHSFCTIASTNDDILFVNGKTTQPLGTESVIWEQNIVFSTTQKEKRYKFCANFKNMPQATFDILPEVEIRVTGGASYTSGFLTINTNPTDPCDWQLEGFDFVASGSVNIQIVLKEDGLGDGNDLAIDDISLQELADPGYSITVQHQGDPQVITGSIFSIDSSDDRLDCESAAGEADYYWYAIEVTGYGPLTYDLSTLGWGNSSSSFVTTPFGSGVGPAWNLTTTYPGYPFAQDTLYLIGLYTPANPDCCLDEGWTYQLTFNHKTPNNHILSATQKEELKALFGVIPGENPTTIGSVRERVSVYPNPATDLLNVNVKNKNIQSYVVTNSFGNVIISDTIRKEGTLLTIPVSNLKQGVYFVKLTDVNNEIITTTFIKK